MGGTGPRRYRASSHRNSETLALYSNGDLARDVSVPPEGQDLRGIALAYERRDGSEVDDVHANVRGFGAHIAKPAQRPFWSGYGGFFSDPDCYLWEVTFNPFWELGPEGNIKL